MTVGDDTLIAQWCIDSENGQEVLVSDGKIIARKINGVIVPPVEPLNKS